MMQCRYMRQSQASQQGEQEPVLLALVIALLVVMGHILLQGSAQHISPVS
jgi:hypothetical protein